jgi:hypothetical protein
MVPEGRGQGGPTFAKFMKIPYVGFLTLKFLGSGLAFPRLFRAFSYVSYAEAWASATILLLKLELQQLFFCWSLSFSNYSFAEARASVIIITLYFLLKLDLQQLLLVQLKLERQQLLLHSILLLKLELQQLLLLDSFFCWSLSFSNYY